MVLAEFRCTLCGHRFELKVLEKDEARDRYGIPATCPKCRSTYLNEIRTIQSVESHAS